MRNLLKMVLHDDIKLPQNFDDSAPHYYYQKTRRYRSLKTKHRDNLEILYLLLVKVAELSRRGDWLTTKTNIMRTVGISDTQVKRYLSMAVSNEMILLINPEDYTYNSRGHHRSLKKRRWAGTWVHTYTLTDKGRAFIHTFGTLFELLGGKVNNNTV